MKLRGRHWMGLWLAGFLVAAALVVHRQVVARAAALELRELEAVRGALEVAKSDAAGDLHQARSRGVLVPLARSRLGLRLPQDSEIIILQEPRLR
jgi:hypothetical protein